MTGYATVPEPTMPTPPPVSPLEAELAGALTEAIWTGAATEPRSQQAALGFSEYADPCARKLAYRMAGTPRVNHRADPLPAMRGTGLHLHLAHMFRRLDAGTGRYLVEHPVAYRGVVGSADLFDRRRATVIDWKTTTLTKLKRLKLSGPAERQQAQVHGYGAGLREAGEDVANVALVWLAIDGSLADTHVWARPLSVLVVDKAISRLADLTQPPEATPAAASPLCPWCPFYRPGTTSPTSQGCPGPTPTKENRD